MILSQTIIFLFQENSEETMTNHNKRIKIDEETKYKFKKILKFTFSYLDRFYVVKLNKPNLETLLITNS
jgi:hypothetical protein